VAWLAERPVSNVRGTPVKKPALVLALAIACVGAPPAAAQSAKYVVVVNPSNPIKRLSKTQLSRIYLGKAQGWDINGKIEPVVVLDLQAGSPLREKFTQDVLRKSMSEAEAYWRQEIYAGRSFPPLEQSEIDALQQVRSAVGGIAYVSATADLKGVKVVSVQE
jgi:ABC-type phosphate transport system substrate-binding protein